MSKSLPIQLTDPARFFLKPSSPTHRQYEALRAYFVEGLSSAEAATRFGYTPGSFRVLCHQFRHNTDPQFFAPVTKGPQTSPKSDPLRERIIRMRKQNFSIYDISQTLREAGTDLSPASISVILKEEGFARLPRRGDEESGGGRGESRDRRLRPTGSLPTSSANQIRRHLFVSSRPGQPSFRPDAEKGWPARFLSDPGSARLALVAGVETVRQRSTFSCHEFGF